MKIMSIVIAGTFLLFGWQMANAGSNERYTLGDLIQQASQNNTDLQSKRFDVDAAAAGVSTAKSQFLPTPSIDSNINKGHEWNGVATLSQPLWTGGKLTSGLNVANAQYALAGSTLADTRFTLTQEIISVWASYHSAIMVYEEQRKGLLYLNSLKTMMVKRSDAGVSGISDLDLVNARILQAESEMSQTDVTRKNALTALSRLVGVNLESSQIDTRTNTLVLPQLTNNELDALINKNSTAIHKAEEQVRVSTEQVGQAKSAIWPTLSLNVDYEKNNSNSRQYNDDARVYLRVQQTFGAGFSSVSAVDSAIATKNSAEMSREYIRAQVYQNSMTNWNNYLAAKDNTKSIAGYQLAIKETLESYQRLFLAGKKSWLDVLNTAREETSARVQLSVAQSQEYACGWLVLLDRGEVKW